MDLEYEAKFQMHCTLFVS